tara:strand:+ start:118 stop:1266 length:1149 start_codon:yes stop_codon:yes gene_type:complete
VNDQRQVLELGLNAFATGTKIKFDVRDDIAQLESPKNYRIKSLDDLIAHCDIDLDLWEIDRYIVNKWEVGSNVDGQVVTEPLFQVKAWLKRKKFDTELFREGLVTDLKKYSKYSKLERPNTLGKCMLEINIFDLHFGKLCWGEETGENYDTKIAEKRFLKAIETLLKRAEGFDIEKIVFPIGNDFFNSDNLRNTTTAGTFQDEDLRWQKTYRKGRELIVKAIDRLCQVADVDVVVVQGNHDFERSFYLGDALECWYDKDENVNVDNNANPRKYVHYGQCLVGFTHGNNEKVANLPMIVAQEKSDIWSKTKYREVHLGHLHHKREIKWISTQEYNGVVVRYMRSLSGTDAWHNQKGYKGSVQSAEAFIWEKNEGLIAQLSFNL